MIALVTISNLADAPALEEYFNAQGLPGVRDTHVRRVYWLRGVSHTDPRLAGIPVPHSVEDGDAPAVTSGAGEEVISLPANHATTLFSYAPPLLIRRGSPWTSDWTELPQRTHFKCARDGSGVDVLVVDSGIRLTHDEFTGRATTEYNYYAPSVPTHEHGTNTGSCAVGAAQGIARGAFARSFICLDSSNSGTVAAISAAMSAALAYYLGTTRPAVLNLSIVSTLSSASFSAGINAAIDAGIPVVVCVGNDGVNLDTVDYGPVESDADLIAVAGTDYHDGPYYFTPATAASPSTTRYGSRVDVCAPSWLCYVATNTGDSDYEIRNGTSYGCAYVSGIVACLLQGQAKLTTRAEVQAIRTQVMSTATAGRVKNNALISLQLPDRLAYLDPTVVAPTPPDVFALGFA